MLVSLFAIAGLLATASAAPLTHVHSKRALPRLGGVNLAGCDFGMNTDGWSGASQCPGTDQITHFASKGANLFRLPVGWQYLVGNNQASTSLDVGFFAKYDALVQATLQTGAYAMIDIHNYARWNGGIIGQGGPTNEQFASLWSLLANKYKNEPKVIFGIMNEPHDVPDNTKWAATVQAAVNAIRAAGATTQSIALPGNFWAHADDWLDGTNAPLLRVTDPATKDKSLLILDIHKYLDGDGSGQNRECTTNGVDIFTQLKSFLSINGYKALISEIGGGNTASCISGLGGALKFIAENPAQFNGFAVWAAGSFAPSYELSITPSNGVDNNLFVQAIQPYLPGKSGTAPSTLIGVSSSAPAKSSVVVSSAAATSSVAVRPSSSTSSRAVPSTTSIRPSPSASSARASTSTVPSASASSARVTTSVRPPPSSSSSSVAASSVPISSAPVSSAPASSVPVSSTSSAAGSTPTGNNFQTYTGTLGGSVPPAVSAAAGGKYTSNGRTYNFLIDALNGSCYVQMDICQAAANRSGNKGDLTVENCNGQQIQACLAAASATANSA